MSHVVQVVKNVSLQSVRESPISRFRNHLRVAIILLILQISQEF